MKTVYLSVGSNLGNRQAHVDQALALIANGVGVIRVVSCSFESPSWGYESPNKYINVAVCVETLLQPMQLLAMTQEIERKIGRKEKTVNGVYHDREIDIDILLFEDLILTTEKLTIPHPQMHHRLFVIHPMNEIAPNLQHPLLKQTMPTIYASLVRF